MSNTEKGNDLGIFINGHKVVECVPCDGYGCKDCDDTGLLANGKPVARKKNLTVEVL